MTTVYLFQYIVICKSIARQRPQHIRPTMLEQCLLCVHDDVTQPWVAVTWYVLCKSSQRSNRLARYRPRDVFSVGPASAPIDWLGSSNVTCVFCDACPCCVYVSEPNSEVISKMEEWVVDGDLVEFRGFRMIEQEMATRLHSDLKC
jgi:hypothetical protein